MNGHQPYRALVTATTGALLALTLGSLPSMGQAEVDETASAVAIPELTLDAADYSFGWPGTVTAGRVAITLENTGQDIHHAQLIRLNEGVAYEDAVVALPNLEEDPAALFSQVTLHGGAGIITPGASQRLIVDLDPGSYVWLCGIPAADGEPHFAKGMIQPFEVVADGGDVGVTEPAADGTVSFEDFAFVLPETIAAGSQLWKVVNDGEQPHEILLAQLAPGATAMDFVAAMDPATASGPPPGLPYGGLQAVQPGTTAWLEVDLQPGTYAAFCFVPDPASGQPHFALGMMAEFTVEGA